MSESWYKVTFTSEDEEKNCLVSFDEYSCPVHYYSPWYAKVVDIPNKPPFKANHGWGQWFYMDEITTEFISDEEATLYILRGYI